MENGHEFESNSNDPPLEGERRETKTRNVCSRYANFDIVHRGGKKRFPPKKKAGFAGPRTIDIRVNRRDVENFKFFFPLLAVKYHRGSIESFFPRTRRRWKQKPFYGNCSATEQCPTSTRNLLFSPSFLFRDLDRWMGLGRFSADRTRSRIMDEKFFALFTSAAMMMEMQRCPSIYELRWVEEKVYVRGIFCDVIFLHRFFVKKYEWRKEYLVVILWIMDFGSKAWKKFWGSFFFFRSRSFGNNDLEIVRVI